MKITKKEIVLFIGGISFIALIFSLSMLLAEKFKVPSCGCPRMISQNFVFLFIFLSIVFVGSMVYFLLSLKLDNQNKIIEKNIGLVHRCLDDLENAVLKEIVKNSGELKQKDLNKKFGKVKAHRGLKKLKEKGMIDINKKGNRNMINLKEEFRRELLK